MSAPRYFYPNRMGRIILASMRRELGPERLDEVLRAAGQGQLMVTATLPNNLEKRFAFETISALQAGTEQIFGAQQGRQISYRVGRGTFDLGLKDFDPVLGIADLPMRLMPLGMKFRVGLDVFARVFNQFSDQIVSLSYQDDRILWIIERCPVCWGRQVEAPCCHLAGGLLEEAMFWGTGGRRFRIEETQCIGRGDAACAFEIDKQPLE